MIGAGIGASVSGALRSGAGSYASGWLLTAGLCLVAGVLPLTMKRGPKTRDDDQIAVPL